MNNKNKKLFFHYTKGIKNFKTYIRNKKIYYEKIIKYILKKENYKKYRMNYIFCDKVHMIILNNNIFKKKISTDVISINYCNYYNKILIGDVYICLQSTYENSLYYQVDFSYEILRNIIHGTLHILGYSDNNEYYRNIMLKKQNKYIIKYIYKYIINIEK
ncbi:MAG: rRNA maturation RNase YbeY [Candidatus Shikimatogenerans sp. Tduv]|uniref:rRNA maturation RNase YbeY n=1 Tax=Candidatus Shikimatogenerans sp. Tduv TaxID=3158567 RepID=A0AAU7QRA8_9FLAO